MRDGWVSVWWQAACLPRRFDVCGIEVPPLSVWHTFALDQMGNPYLCAGKADKDAALAVLLIARHNRDAGRRLLRDDAYRVRESKRLARRVRRVSMDILHAAVLEYVILCTRSASRWHKGDETFCAVPYQWHIVQRLTTGNPDKAALVWDMPYAEARCLCDAAAEQSGDTTIMRDDAQEMEDNWKKYQRAG